MIYMKNNYLTFMLKSAVEDIAPIVKMIIFVALILTLVLFLTIDYDDFILYDVILFSTLGFFLLLVYYLHLIEYIGFHVLIRRGYKEYNKYMNAYHDIMNNIPAYHYISKDLKNMFAKDNLHLTAFDKFVIVDDNRKGIDYGRTLKCDYISDVNNFFEQ